MIDPQRATQPIQRAQQRHGRNEWSDEANGFRRVTEHQHPKKRPRGRIDGREQAPAGPVRRVRFRFACNRQPHAASPEDRLTGLRSWERAPGAQVAHPREEHLLPLMVVAGAARGDASTCCYHEELFFGTGDLSNFMFGKS